jgi:hypothetical protein
MTITLSFEPNSDRKHKTQDQKRCHFNERFNLHGFRNVDIVDGPLILSNAQQKLKVEETLLTTSRSSANQRKRILHICSRRRYLSFFLPRLERNSQ